MPKYRITAKNGGVYEIEAADDKAAMALETHINSRIDAGDPDITQAPPNTQVIAGGAEQPAPTGEAREASFVEGLAQGINKPLNNAAGWLEAGLDKIGLAKPIQALGAAMGMAPSVDAAVEEQQRVADAAPYRASGLGEFTGNIVGTIPTAMLPGGAFVQGAAGGALLSDSDTATGVGADALLGGVGGKLADMAFRGAARVVKPVVNDGLRALINAGSRATTPPTSARSAATKIIGRALADEGIAPREAGDIISSARERGVPLGLMDVGEETRGLAASLARKPGANRRALREAISGRQDAQLERVQGAIARDLGPTANVRAQSEDLIRQAQEAASPLYEQAYSAPVISTPELASLLDTPFGRQALARARTIAANERRNPEGLGFALDEAGDVVLNPIPHEALGDLGAAETRAFAAENALKRAQAGQLTGGGRAGDVSAAQAEFDAATEALNAARSSLASQPTVSTAAAQRGYTTQTLDYVKRGMDDVIESQRDPITGRLRLDEAGRAQNDVLRKFLGEVDRLNPAYGEARAAYAGPAKLSSALRKGNKITNKSAEDIWAETRDLSPAELEQYRLGARSALSSMMEGRTDAADKVRALVGTPKKREALEYLFGGEEGFSRLISTLGDEGRASETFARAYTGSPTARNLADDEGLSGLSGVTVGALSRAVRGNGLVSNGIETISDLIRYGVGARGAAVRNELSSILTQDYPDTLSQIIHAGMNAPRSRRDMARSVVSELLRYGAQAAPVAAPASIQAISK